MRAFIFDLDGVIVFTDKFHYRAWKKMADKIGVYFDETINNRLRGVSRKECLEIILERYDGVLSEETKTELMEMKNNFYKELLKEMGPKDVPENVKKTLKALKERGARLAIGSSSKNAKYILNQVKLTDMFDAISDGTNITYSKPNPEVFLKAAEFMNLEPNLCVVVEDAKAGIDAAKAAGMKAVGIGVAAGYEKADYRIDTFEKLLDIIKYN